jgi:hypothetical protein
MSFRRMRQPGDRHDPRLVYGARCVWWDHISKASTNAVGLPCCPHCGSVLFEVDGWKTWDANVAAFALKSGDANYPAFMKWLRGRCFPDIATARAAFDAEGAKS